MAVLLNQSSSLRFRIELVRRISDGITSPASLAMEAYVERYRHEPQRGYTPLLAVPKATLLDLDLIQFLESLEEMLEAVHGGDAARTASLEASIEPTVAIRIGGGPEAFQVEIGIDLLNVLEPVAGVEGARGADLALFQFFANGRAVLAFCQGLLQEFARFPTDPAKVAKGTPG
ncbi:MAG: hypothetical protein E6J62_04915 [Deltaproteobacteria bacterium]|nr:MAG: hypothetical protein E6J62_04915 [Deltaproteobacteria bacterium]